MARRKRKSKPPYEGPQEALDIVSELSGLDRELSNSEKRRLRCAKRRIRMGVRDHVRKQKEENELKSVTLNVPKRVKMELAIHCVNYQHRLCWMLSSILEQQGDVPDILINISHPADNGSPTTEEVGRFFRDKGLNIVHTVMSDEDCTNRAIARNKQMSETKADWLLLADCDMVYDPWFFDDLHKKMRGEISQYKHCIGGDRYSLDIDFCENFFDTDPRIYPCVVENSAAIVSRWPVWYVNGKKIAPGFFQLANVEVIRLRGATFSEAEIDGLNSYKGDRHFRVNMGGRLPMEVKPQYHLNHRRTEREKQR